MSRRYPSWRLIGATYGSTAPGKVNWMRMQICVVLLNWNGWKDTIECLESVFRLACEDFRIVVCDNASTDGSVEKIRQWARGELTAGCANPQLSGLTSPPVPKTIQ